MMKLRKFVARSIHYMPPPPPPPPTDENLPHCNKAEVVIAVRSIKICIIIHVTVALLNDETLHSQSITVHNLFIQH